MSRTAVIILNRNMPDLTDCQVEEFLAHDCGESEVFVVESGSSQNNLSKYCTWWADWPEALREGLRYPRGFNFGLAQIHRSGRFEEFDYFLLVCNDVEFTGPMVSVLSQEMDDHPQLGILSPCARNWAERDIMGENATRYVCHCNHLIWMVRRGFIEAIMEREKPDHMNFLYDGTNFRGYYADQELVIKGYINEFATAITSKALFNERTELLKTRHDLMQTDRYEINLRRIFDEGRQWMHRKYGFSTRLQMNMYAEMYYQQFFTLYPHLQEWKL